MTTSIDVQTSGALFDWSQVADEKVRNEAQTHIHAIWGALNAMRLTACQVAVSLKSLRQTLSLGGYADSLFFEVAKVEFGYSESTSRRLIAVADKYIQNAPVLGHAAARLTKSAWLCLLDLSSESIAEISQMLPEHGDIKPADVKKAIEDRMITQFEDDAQYQIDIHERDREIRDLRVQVKKIHDDRQGLLRQIELAERKFADLEKIKSDMEEELSNAKTSVIIGTHQDRVEIDSEKVEKNKKEIERTRRELESLKNQAAAANQELRSITTDLKTVRIEREGVDSFIEDVALLQKKYAVVLLGSLNQTYRPEILQAIRGLKDYLTNAETMLTARAAAS